MENIVGKTKHGEIDIDSLAAIRPCMSKGYAAVHRALQYNVPVERNT